MKIAGTHPYAEHYPLLAGADLDELVASKNRYKNMRDAANAYDEWRVKVYDRALDAVVAHGTFGAAVDAGEFR